MNKNHQLALFWEALGLKVEHRFLHWPENQWMLYDTSDAPSQLLKLFENDPRQEDIVFRIKPQ